MRRRHAPPSPSCEPVTVLDPCTKFAAISECRYPRSLWCTRRGRKMPGHPLIRQSAGCAHITRSLRPVARRRDHRLPSSERAVSIQILWCTLNACMSMVGLHWDNFWDDGGQHGQESEEGKEDSQEDGQEEKEVVVRRDL